MRKIKEVLRLKYELNLGQRQIARRGVRADAALDFIFLRHLAQFSGRHPRQFRPPLNCCSGCQGGRQFTHSAPA